MGDTLAGGAGNDVIHGDDENGGTVSGSGRIDVSNYAETGAGFTVTADLMPGDPDEVIAAQVKEREINLLVMGAYGHSRVRNLILGSTTTHLIRTCLVPVTLFR